MDEQKNTIQEQMVRVSISSRIISAFIDYLPMLLLGLIAYVVAFVMAGDQIYGAVYKNSVYLSPEETLIQLKAMLDVLFVFVLPFVITGCISYIYFLSKDFFGGQSIGKRFQKSQLVSLDGGPVSYTRMFVRNLFLVIWPVELLLYLLNSGQRLGDILCKTTVVHATKENKQPINTKKLIIAFILIVVICSLISYIYYHMLIAFFYWYYILLESLFMRGM